MTIPEQANTPAPLNRTEATERDLLCEDIFLIALDLGRDAMVDPSPFTDRQALKIGLALQELRELVEGWRK